MLRNQQKTSSKKNYLSVTLLPLHCRKPTINSSSEISTCTPLTRECTMPYGVAENVHTTAAMPSLKENISRPTVSVSVRKHHLETYFIRYCRKFITAISRS